MNQDVIDKYNVLSEENDQLFVKAERAMFPWQYFWDRTLAKVRDSGFLPSSGFLVIDARYVNSAEAIRKGLFASIESVGEINMLVGRCTPWQDVDLQRFKEVVCSLTCSMFDAGVVASMTRAPKGEVDPVAENGAFSIFGDVGFMGLRDKSLKFVRSVGGDSAVEMMGEVGDCACLHLYADCLNTERAFKMSEEKRMAYVLGACKAAYLAGAVFGEQLCATANRVA